ncbi:MAG: hypothetical protein WBG92_03945 [Thiohalocapsa sp.]
MLFVAPHSVIEMSPGELTPRRRSAFLRDILRSSDTRRRLLHWNRQLARSAGCGWIPTRAWRRQSALICARHASTEEALR